jgi:hypothetical protein
LTDNVQVPSAVVGDTVELVGRVGLRTLDLGDGFG